MRKASTERKREMNRDVKRLLVAGYLDYIAGIDEAVTRLDESIRRTEAALTLGAVRYRDMPGNPNTDPDGIPEGIARLEELKDRWEGDASAMAAEWATMLDFCMQSTPRRICWLHYVDGLTWGRVARKVGYSQQHARRLAWQGINEIYEIVPESFRRSAIPKAQEWEDSR